MKIELLKQTEDQITGKKLIPNGTKIIFDSDTKYELNGTICGVYGQSKIHLGVPYIVKLDSNQVDYNYDCVLVWELYIKSILD